MSKRSPHHKSQDRLLGTTKVYCMSNWPKFWVSKFGITDHAKARARNVSETTFGTAYHIIPPFNLFWGFWCEQFVHALYFIVNAPFRKGSGKSEWYINFNPVTCILLWSMFGNFAPIYEWALIAISPVIWLDGLFWLIVFYFFKLAVTVAILAIIVQVIIHL